MATPNPAGSNNGQLFQWAKKLKSIVDTLVSAPVANSSLANMTAPSVKARGTAGTGSPEDIGIGNGLVLDATSLRTLQQMSVAVDGSGLKLSGDSASPGNSKYYGTDSGGSKGFFDFPASGGGLTRISSTSVGAGTSVTITGLGGYKILIPVCRELSHNSGSSQSFRFELSGDNGSTFGTVINPGIAFTAATLVSGWFLITNADQANQQGVLASGFVGGVTLDNTSRGPINAIRISPSAGNFDNGTVDVYGLK